MKIFTITLSILLVLSFAAVSPTGAGDFNPFPYNPDTGAAGGGPSCASAIGNANRAFTQLVTDLKGKAYQWSINSDFDAVDEVSYYLKSKCKTEYLDLINSGQTGVNKTQDEACEKLMMLLVPLLEQKKATSFRGSFEGGVELVAKGRRIAKNLGDECKPLLIARKAEEVKPEGAEALVFEQEKEEEEVGEVASLRMVTSEYDQNNFEIVVDAEEEEEWYF